MNTYPTNPTDVSTRQAAIRVLAVIGFIALIGAGMWLAVYSTRFVPSVVNRIGAAAVYLGSVFRPSEAPNLSIVPTPVASTTLPFDGASSTIPAKTPATTPAKRVPTTAGSETSGAYQIGTTTPSSRLGLPDLIVTVNAIGYLATTSADSFVASSTVPAGSRPAIRFTIKNVGTNVAGTWRFSASIPTQTAYIYQSQPQQSLNPGDSIDYTLGFDHPIPGFEKMISVTANFDHAVAESNSSNNSASAKITILGS